MQKISRITVQKKNKNRYNIFLEKDKNEVYGFSVQEDTLIAERLQKGMELEDTTIDSLLAKDTIHKGYSLGLNFLSYRMRSVNEMEQYLKKKEIDEEHISIIIKRLSNEKWLDDAVFAEAYVRTKVLTTSKGPLIIKKELLEKRVAVDKAEAALVHYPAEAQLEKVIKFIEKSARKSAKQSFFQQQNKLKQNLMQKGFPQAIIQEAFNQATQEKDQEQEWDAVVFQGEKLLRRHASKLEKRELKQKVKGALYQKGFSLNEIEKFIESYIEQAEE
ncbi:MULTISPECIES: recombination regulator RecX [Paraliobacillus]|uniref:recombination regulator RecX n=1 Tax=Paraliobacillus TaxID=200903 RepID=UPI000E3EA70A|nr:MULTISPECIES: recombination regulator RecX [Paraliobacillus]